MKQPSQLKHLKTTSIYKLQADFLVFIHYIKHHTFIYKAFFFI